MFTFKRSLHLKALDSWISIPNKSVLLLDRLSTEHLSDLFITLPTRDGSRATYVPPLQGSPLPYGHHLAFFHPRNPEHVLRNDGTDADFCPPEPFTRRMWAGGKMKWNHSSPLLVGSKAKAVSTVAKVDKKNFDGPAPMVFVKQSIEYSSDSGIGIEEERSHVYLPQTTAGETKRGPRQGSSNVISRTTPTNSGRS
jgi:hydroxyacyl-ACP dehydratase HTD2-like protein with hotdog domain